LLRNYPCQGPEAAKPSDLGLNLTLQHFSTPILTGNPSEAGSIMTRRTQRLGDLILREISTVIQNEIRDPRVGFITVSRVDVSADLAYADVYVSVMGGEKEQKDSMAGLISSSSYIRKYLAINLRARTVPKLKFVLDKNLDHSEKINELLKKIDSGKNIHEI
jgi:ribosome-binding factor A